MSITSIRRCDDADIQDTPETILRKCLINEYSGKTEIGDIIGSGSYGKVYKGKYYLEFEEIDIAIKIVVSENEEEEINNMVSEVEYSYRMSSQGIGPKVYDSFYMTTNNRLITYIIMELFDGTLYDAYEEENLSIQNYQNLNQQLLQLLKIQIFENDMYCVDIKTSNFVYRKRETDYELKMIDFGEKFCSLGDFDEKIYVNKDIFYVILVIQLMLMIRTNDTDGRIFLPFYLDSRIKKYFSNKNALKDLKKVLYNIIRLPYKGQNKTHIVYLCHSLGIDQKVVIRAYDYGNDEIPYEVMQTIIDDIREIINDVHNNYETYIEGYVKGFGIKKVRRRSKRRNGQ